MKNKKIKFNWGTGIITASIVFISFTVITGVTLMNQDVDLVAENYYDKELKYQDHIDRLNRSALMENNINVEYTGSKLKISLKDTAGAASLNGTIKFYRPSDSKKDFELKLQPGAEGIQYINTSGMEKGLWKVQLLFTLNSRDLYFEKPVVIN